MSRAKTTCYAPLVVLQRLLGLQKKNLSDRNVKSEKVDGRLVYDLDEVIGSCGDMAYSHLRSKYADADGIDIDELKMEKTREEIRKLKIDNDVQEGMLVPASDVAVTYNKAIRSVCDVLDALPSRVKMENPDISAATLDSINRCLIEVRNKAAGVLDDVN